MPRYHFSIHDGVLDPDPEGLDLPNGQAAWAEAVRACGEMLRDLDGDLPKNSEWRMDVTDDTGTPVFTLRFLTTEHVH